MFIKYVICFIGKYLFVKFYYIRLYCYAYMIHMRGCDCAPCFTIATFDGLAPRFVSEIERKKVNYHAGTFKMAKNILRDLLAT